jgi:RNA polymerase-interacting CarD/CdnL/TRCF family regulator
MIDKIKFKRGDKVVKYGKTYRIVKVKKGVIVYKPYFKEGGNNSLVSSIPLKSIKDNYIRKLVSKYRLREFIKKILYKRGRIEQVNITEIKASLGENDMSKTLTAVKKMWLEQKDKSRIMAKSRKDVYKQARRQATEEIALVRGVSLEEAKLMLDRALNRGFENG